VSERIGFVSTRFSGTDGVSLESAKWARILWDHRHVSYWYAGKLDRDPGASMLVPEAYFYDRDNVWINERAFGIRQRLPELTRKIYEVAEHLKHTLYEFKTQFEIEILVVENALCLPMHIPLGVALTHFIAETATPTIAHHHDFYWERPRFSVNAVGDFLTIFDGHPCVDQLGSGNQWKPFIIDIGRIIECIRIEILPYHDRSFTFRHRFIFHCARSCNILIHLAG